MPRFVILYHRTPPHADAGSHWDMMFEMEGGLFTWELPIQQQSLPQTHEPVTRSGPAAEATIALPAQLVWRLADHRLEYLTYEGPLSGNRGDVRRVVEGEFSVDEFSEDRMRITLQTVRQLGDPQPRFVSWQQQKSLCLERVAIESAQRTIPSRADETGGGTLRRKEPWLLQCEVPPSDKS